MTNDQKMKIAMIGNGKSTNRYHVPFILQRPEKMEIKTIWRRSPSRDAWAPLQGVNYTTDLTDILEDDDIDLVVVCTRQDSHYEYAKMALEAGKNVLVEKPFTQTYEQARELFDLAKEKGLFCSAYQNRRFDSDFLTVQKVIESDVLGDLLEAEMHFDYYRPEISENCHEYSADTSFLYGHACHTLDQVLSYFGLPDDVHYDVRQLLGPGRMNDYFDLDLYYKNFKVSVKSSYFRVKSRPSFVVYGTRGMFVKETKDRQEDDLKKFYMPVNKDFGLDRPEHYGTLTYYDEAGTYHEEKVVSEPGDYARFYDAVYESIMNGKEQLVTPEQTLAQMEMLEKGVRSLH
ncbi:MAG: oxidoreductase [Ileibacterium sp.]|nr:oxidoreductase [Ileibacterium sp.]